MTPNLSDQGSLQRGAQTYMNYCLGCHSLKYQRYKRTAEDIGVPESLMLQHLVFDPNTKIGSLIENSISSDNAKSWFGAVPPDLTLYTQLKGGPEYLYTYLLTFYEDPSRPLGANNLVYENVGMPHALAELQGVQEESLQTDSKARSQWWRDDGCVVSELCDGRSLRDGFGRKRVQSVGID